MEEQNRGAPVSQGATILRGKSALPSSGNPYDGERLTDHDSESLEVSRAEEGPLPKRRARPANHA